MKFKVFFSLSNHCILRACVCFCWLSSIVQTVYSIVIIYDAICSILYLLYRTRFRLLLLLLLLFVFCLFFFSVIFFTYMFVQYKQCSMKHLLESYLFIDTKQYEEMKLKLKRKHENKTENILNKK